MSYNFEAPKNMGPRTVTLPAHILVFINLTLVLGSHLLFTYTSSYCTRLSSSVMDLKMFAGTT
jgi:hypothetical protein